MHRHAERPADRLTAPGLGQTIFIERMARFMQHAHQGGGDFRLVVACGDAHIVRRAAAKRMLAFIETAVIEVEAERRHQSLSERFLLHRRKGSLDRQRLLLAGEHLLEKARQKIRETLEDRIDIGAPETVLEAVEQRVIGR